VSAPSVRVESREGGVHVLTMDKSPVNALGRELVDALLSSLQALRANREARCLVVRSAGNHFCAGADLKERRGMTQDEVRAFVPKLAAVCNEIAALPFPTIAAVRGTAAGGGCELALACDLRVLAAGGTCRLPRIAGLAVAKRWIFTAQLFTADEARIDRVADEVVSGDRLDDRALALAGTIAANGPIAVRLAKKAIDGGFDLPIDRALALEWQCYEGVLDTADRVEALTAFAEKRPPRFTGR
jgi:methylglutaconyl-CoA hydratase